MRKMEDAEGKKRKGRNGKYQRLKGNDLRQESKEKGNLSTS